jgi:hypothetical protein
MSSFAGTPVSAPPSNIGASRSTVARSSRPRRQIVLRVSHDLRRNLRDLPPCGRSARVELIFRPGQPLVLPRIDSVRFRSSSFPPPDGLSSRVALPLSGSSNVRAAHRPPVVYPAPADPAFAFSNASPIHVHVLAHTPERTCTSSCPRIRTKRAWLLLALPSSLRCPNSPTPTAHEARNRVVGSHIFRCRCRSARCARSISFVLTGVVDLSIDDPAMPRSMPPRLAAFLRRRTFEICGFWPISRGGQIRVRGDSMFCERGCSPIFRPGCTGSTVRSCDLSETRLRMSTFPCPCASFATLSSRKKESSLVRADVG